MLVLFSFEPFIYMVNIAKFLYCISCKLVLVMSFRTHCFPKIYLFCKDFDSSRRSKQIHKAINWIYLYYNKSLLAFLWLFVHSLLYSFSSFYQNNAFARHTLQLLNYYVTFIRDFCNWICMVKLINKV